MNYRRFLAQRSFGLHPSPIRALVPLMKLPGMISFGGGYPHSSTFAFQSQDTVFKSGSHFSMSDEEMVAATQYGPSDCHPDLLNRLLEWHDFKDGVKLSKDQILLLNGSQEGLHMMAYLFLESDDCVALSEPAYPGALGAFRAFCNQFVTFPLDANGSRVDLLKEKLHQRRTSGLKLPKFIYEVPNGHNPGGVRLSLDRRHQLLDVAREFDLLILEDDPYELLQLEDTPPLPTLQSLDTDGRVVRLDSFSKIFAPGLRIGYASGPAELIQKFIIYKQGLNLHTSALSQKTLAGFFTVHSNDQFLAMIKRNCTFYRKNRDLMIQSIKKHFPTDIVYNIPNEGMFIWFQGPSDMDIGRLVEEHGQEAGVLVVPGSAFSPTGSLNNCMRASFSMVPPDLMDEGVRRLASLLKGTCQG